MSVTLQTDLTEFKATLNKYLAETSKALPDAINAKAGRVACRAIVETQKADRAEIERLGVSGYRVVRSRKTGTTKRGKPIYNEFGRMRDIIAARYHAKGETLPGSGQLKTEIEKAIASRLRSIGFIRSGWIPAYRKLKRYIGQALTWNSARQSGKPKGRAVIAREGFNPVATIANSALPSEQAKRIGEAGLAKAFRAETADMKIYLERKLKEAARKSGVEVR